jgi:hypothetical protein
MVVHRQIKIITTYEGPSPPGLRCSWTAVTEDYDGPGSPMGIELTEALAVKELYEELDERDAEEADRTLATLIKRAEAQEG